MSVIRVVRDPHNLSHSRVTGFFGCPARLGYEGIYDEFRRLSSPYWLPGGAAVHYIVDWMIKKFPAQGKLLLESDIDKVIMRRAKGHIWAVLSGKTPPKGHDDPPTRIQSIFWMSEEEKSGYTEAELTKEISERTWRYINKQLNGIRAIALRCTQPSPFIRTIPGERFQIELTSPRDPEIKIPVWGELDVNEQHQSNGLMITDFKTGSFDHYLQQDLEGNEQMMIYWLAIREKYHVDPLIAYFVSLTVYKDDLDKYGPAVLEQDKYRVHARINFEKHFPEMLNEFDDVWAVLNFLAHPPETAEARMERDAWEPRSALGIKADMKRHVVERRLIPNIGRQCGMCPARSQCQSDNNEDWEDYRNRQKLGNVVDQLVNIPEEWMDPANKPDVKLFGTEDPEILPETGQLHLFDVRRPVRVSPLKKYKFSAKEWKERGSFTPKEWLAILRRMHELIPVDNGEVCPCKRTERIQSFFLNGVQAFFSERELHKLAQEKEGKKRGGKGDEKVKELYNSNVVRELLAQCTVEECPFSRKKKDDEAQPAA